MIVGTSNGGLQTHSNSGVAQKPPSKMTARPSKKSKKTDTMGTTAEIQKNHASATTHLFSDSKSINNVDLHTHLNSSIAQDLHGKKTARASKKSKQSDAMGTTAGIQENHASAHPFSDSKTPGLKVFADTIKRTPYEVNQATSATLGGPEPKDSQPKAKSKPKPKPKPATVAAEPQISLERTASQIDHNNRSTTQTQQRKVQTPMQTPTGKKAEDSSKSQVPPEAKANRKRTLRDMRQQIKAVAPEYAALEASIDWEAVHEKWETAKAKPKSNLTWLEEFVLHPKADPEEVGEDIVNSDDEDEGDEDDDEAIKTEMDGFIVDDEEF